MASAFGPAMVGGFLGHAFGGATGAAFGAAAGSAPGAAADLKAAEAALVTARAALAASQAGLVTANAALTSARAALAAGTGTQRDVDAAQRGFGAATRGVAGAASKVGKAEGGVDAAAAAAEMPVIGMIVSAAKIVNEQFDKVAAGLGEANTAVIHFATGMAQTFGVPKSIAELGGAVLNLFSPLKAAEMGVKGLQFALMPLLNLDKPGEILKDVFKSVADVGSKLVTVFLDLRDPAAMLTQAISPFISQVNKFNPGIVERMNLAFDNLSAAAGRIFEPIITVAEGFADHLNRIYTTIGPQMQSLVASIAGPISALAREFVDGFFGMIQQSIPVFQQMIESMRPLGPVVRDLGSAMIKAAGSIIAFMAPVIAAGANFVAWMHSSGLGFEVLKIAAIALGVVLAGLAIGFASVFGPFILLGAAIVAVVYGLYKLADTLASVTGFKSWIENKGRQFGEWLGTRRPEGSTTTAPIAATGGMTYAAQPARHISIEDVGMEARRAAFSQGSDVQTQQLRTQEQIAAAAQAQLVLLRQLVQQGALSINALPPGVMI